MVLELIPVALFIALGAFLCWDAGLKVSRNVLILFGVILLAVCGVLAIAER
jgi:drug/metabolite transporter superfamily protein YnfA